jgi:outer membrane protein OmpA-like peptidoglycan-associated protein
MKKHFLFATIIFLGSLLPSFAQELKPTLEKALIKTIVTNESKKPLSGEQVTFTSKKSGEQYKGVTDSEGKFQILLPIGATYVVDYKNFTKKVTFNELTIPSDPALYTWDVDISFEPARVIVLENVEYDFNKATIRASSYKTLNDLVEVMTLKPNYVIEIGGHTDNVGKDESNIILSQNRANAIKQYLVKKGVNADRIIAKGYGEAQPIATNDTDEGRQKNRRTEIKIVKE